MKAVFGSVDALNIIQRLIEILHNLACKTAHVFICTFLGEGGSQPY